MTNIADEYERQIEMLVAKGYPELAGVSEEEFRRELDGLRPRLPEIGEGAFVVVVSVPWERAMPLVDLRGKSGFMDMTGADVPAFRTIESVRAPKGPYLLVDFDAGGRYLNVTPDDALKSIEGEGRSALTVEEGIAVVTHYPEVLREQNAFSLLATRSGDRRVPAIWLSSGRPRLGWCWAGNPHTWLGSASCRARLS